MNDQGVQLTEPDASDGLLSWGTGMLQLLEDAHASVAVRDRRQSHSLATFYMLLLLF